jgi:hypothetical protein
VRLVANAWTENTEAERARDRAVARLSTISAEARALGLTDPMTFPWGLFVRWARALTSASSWGALAFARWARHSYWHHVLQPGRCELRTRRMRTVLARRIVVTNPLPYPRKGTPHE